MKAYQQENVMSYNTIMVHLHLGDSNYALLNVAKNIAEQFNAKVIGAIVGQQTQIIYGRGYAMMDFFDLEDSQLEKEINEAEASFRKTFKGYKAPIEWRSKITREPMIDYITSEARSADLIITSISPSDFYQGPAAVTASEIVMKAGRPVLVVPNKVENFKFDTVLVGWKETREARRAIMDALPVLQLAKQVTVVELANKSDKKAATKHLQDVANWLKLHNINANCVTHITKDDDATDFVAIAKKQKANLVVAGAYGHSRLREWALGGVTDELLHSTKFCSLLSH
jgi:nucleotide-binding universal stress UspA family protein